MAERIRHSPDRQWIEIAGAQADWERADQFAGLLGGYTGSIWAGGWVGGRIGYRGCYSAWIVGGRVRGACVVIVSRFWLYFGRYHSWGCDLTIGRLM